MRKWLVSIVIIVVALLLGIPYVMGIMAENQITQLVVNGSKTPNMQVRVAHYDRGWFKSKAEIDVALQVPDKRPAINGAPQSSVRTIRFTINENVIHGPVIFKDGIKFGLGYVRSDIELTQQQQQMLQTLFIAQGQLPHATVSMLIKLSGAIASRVDVPAFTLVAKSDQTTVKWLGLNGYWHVAKNMKQIKGRLTIAGIHANKPQMQLQMGKLDVTYNETQDNAGFWVGNVAINFPTLEITQDKHTVFSLSGLKMVSDSSINMQKLLDTTLSIDLAKVMINQLSYGPASYQSSIKNLDTQALIKIQQQLQAANNSTMTPQQKSVLMMSIWPLVPEVFNKGAVYDLQKLLVTLPEGVVNANGKITMPTATAGESLSIAQLYKKIDANFTVEAPIAVTKKAVVNMMVRRINQQQTLQAALAQQLKQQATTPQQNTPAFTPLTQQQIQTQAEQAADNQINQWITAGFLAKENDNYKLAAQLQQGKLSVNGKTLFGDNAANQPMTGPGPVLPQNQNTSAGSVQPSAQQQANPAAQPTVAPAANQQQQNVATPAATVTPAVAPTAVTVQPQQPVVDAPAVQPQPSVETPAQQSPAAVNQ